MEVEWEGKGRWKNVHLCQRCDKMLGKCPEKQVTVMINFCIVFPTGPNFPLEETQVDSGEGEVAPCGAEDGCEGFLCKIKIEKEANWEIDMGPN